MCLLFSHCLRNDTWITAASVKPHTEVTNAFSLNQGLLLQDRNKYLHHFEVRTAVRVLSKFYQMPVHTFSFFFFKPFSTLVSACQGSGRRFRWLRINCFNLSSSFSLSSSHTRRQAATHLPLLPAFKELSSPQTTSFLINFYFSLIALGNESARCLWYIAHPRLHARIFFFFVMTDS